MAARQGGIGGSDVAALLGLDKYKSPRHIYEAKHACPKAAAAEKAPSEAAEIGTEIEDFVANLFSKRSGVPIAMPPGMLVHHEHDWMLANVDRYTLWDEATGHVQGPLEVKNRSAYQLADWDDDNVPDAPALQCHWYMAVGGWDAGYVAALVGGNKLKWHRIERDEDMIGQLVEFCGAWYQRHVVEGCPPPADGLQATADLLSKLWSVKADAVAEVDLATAMALQARHAEIKAAQEALATDLTKVENEMRLLTGDAEIAMANGRRVWTWKQNSTFAPKKFAEAEPELVKRYTVLAPKLDVARLKKEEPKTYTRFRARQLRVLEAI
ncbi:YqaJ viral recombinase family nuclease [Embleya sp. NPDC001921]